MGSTRAWVAGISLLLLVAWLAPLISPQALVALVAAAAIALAIAALRKVRLPKLKGARQFEVELLPPAKLVPREPTTFAALVEAVGRSGVGPFEVRRRALTVRVGGGSTTLEVADPSRVTLADVTVRSSTHLSATLTLDAVAQALGPFTARLDGVELKLDGTVPRPALEAELWRRQTDKVRELELALRAPGKPEEKKYLH